MTDKGNESYKPSDNCYINNWYICTMFRQPLNSEFNFDSRFIVSFIFILFLLSNYTFSQGNHGLSFGGSDNDLGYSICLTPDSNYAIAGTTRSNGSGSNDLYLLILSKDGQVLQERNYGWEHPDYFRKIIQYLEALQ